MTDITKIDHDGPVTTCGIDGLETMTLGGWRVLAVTKTTVPRRYNGQSYNQRTNAYEETYLEAHEALEFVLGKSKDTALEEAWASKKGAVAERDQALNHRDHLLKELTVANEEIAKQQRHLREAMNTIESFESDKRGLRESLAKGEKALADLRRDFAKVKAAIGELRVKEILG